MGILVATRLGVGVSPDSIYYLDGARHLLRGQGFSTGITCTGEPLPILHWPPFFSFLRAVSGWFGAELLLGARSELNDYSICNPC